MWILFFCAPLVFPPEPLEARADCDPLGVFETSTEAVEFGRDYCFDEFHCLGNVRITYIEPEGDIFAPNPPLQVQ